MVREGWALAFVRYSRNYVEEESAAHAGLWAGAFIAPWDWRARNAQTVVLGAAHVPANAQMLLLGVASSSHINRFLREVPARFNDCRQVNLGFMAFDDIQGHVDSRCAILKR